MSNPRRSSSPQPLPPIKAVLREASRRRRVMSGSESPTTEFKKKTLASKEAFGDNSYYYWHQKHSDARGYEDRAPKKLDEKVVTSPTGPRFKAIASYAFLDGSKGVARVYVDLNGVGELPSSSVTCVFSARKFELTVLDLKGENLRLVVDCLYEDVDTESSSVVVKPDRLIVTLKKAVDLPWSSLKREK